MEESNSGTMIKLTSSNYDIWKSRMEDLLYCKDAYAPLTGMKPVDTSDEVWKVSNRKIIALIRQCVDDSVYHHISIEIDAKDLWEKLESLYERKTAQNKAFYIKKMVNMKYQEGSSVSDHLSQFQDCVNRLSTMKMVLDEELQPLILLSSLPDSWETLVVSLSNSVPNGIVTLAMVKDSMLNEELRHKELGITSESSALVIENRGRSTHRTSHDDDKRDKSKRRPKSRKGIVCYYCKKSGHMKNECQKLKAKNDGLKRDKFRGRGGDDEKEHTAAIASDEDVFIACDERFVNLTCHDSTWVVDSATSFHVTSRRDLFFSDKEEDYGVVRMRDNGVCKISGIGDVNVETSLGCKLTLKNVRHVPDMRLDLISVGALDDDGYQSHFFGGKWKLLKGFLVVARVIKSGSLYVTQVKMCGEVNVSECNSTNLWHLRLGHMSENGIEILSKKNYVPIGTSLTSCTHCLTGKQHRVAFKRNLTSKKSGLLDLVHTDLCDFCA
jgi:gag-polypeptide of LTR copia-type/GAG-pre-integrase domain/Zinc knuckle